jgi:hypothetical protein
MFSPGAVSAQKALYQATGISLETVDIQLRKALSVRSYATIAIALWPQVIHRPGYMLSETI